MPKRILSDFIKLSIINILRIFEIV